MGTTIYRPAQQSLPTFGIHTTAWSPERFRREELELLPSEVDEAYGGPAARDEASDDGEGIDEL